MQITNQQKKKIKTGSTSFNDYYSGIYGERWRVLRESLFLPSAAVPYCDGLLTPYFLDNASILAALSLRLPQNGSASTILDACAAPGGKSLVIASRMAPDSTLLSNELSGARRRRLTVALEKHLPPEILGRVRVSGFDAAQAAVRMSERGRFSAVLLDAPCSSERHVIQSKTALEKWTPARPRYLAQREWSLLSAAFLLLAAGGSLVYSTCSLNPEENDGVSERLLNKYGSRGNAGSNGYCLLDKPEFTAGEETKYGKIILPDTAHGAGPIYVARFKKVQ